MKLKLLIFLFIIFLSLPIIAQKTVAKKVDDSGTKKTYKVDARKFLEKYENNVEDFLKKNLNYFEERKLSKVDSWDFSVGSTKDWYALNFTNDNFYSVSSTCRAVGEHCYIFVEDAIWNSEVNLSNVNAIQDAFDNSTPADNNKGIYQTVVESFGNPPDVDNDSKIIILILDIVDGYDGSGGYIAGYFHSINQVSTSNSNMAEIYYLDANPSDLSTTNGLNNVMSTTAHEFQHMVHFNYHNGSSGKPSQITFLNEGCSLVSEVICGYQIYNQSLFNNESNHYLFDWRSGDDVLNDYSRAARYVTYIYEQFGIEFLRNFVQNSLVGVAGINSALETLTNPTSLRFPESLENWFNANIINDKSINSAWGYSVQNVNKVIPLNNSNPNVSSGTVVVEKAASDYITYTNGKNLSIQFNDFSSGKLRFKVIKTLLNDQTETDEISAGTDYSFPELGNTHKSISFAIMNTDQNSSYSYSYNSSGDASTVELAYDENPPSGVLSLSPNDIVCVFFDGVQGGRLDSIKVALRQAGLVHGGIYEFSGVQNPSPLGNVLLSDLTVTSNISETPPNPYPVPWPNWVTVDLTSYNIDASNSFVTAFTIEGTYPQTNRIMITEQSDENNHSYSYLGSQGGWYTLTSSSSGLTYVYLIRAYVSFGITDIEELTVINIPNQYKLEQNYPNPFNPTTQINFSIPKSGKTKLAVYNNLGQTVKILLDKIVNVGNYTINFEGTNLSSGVYYFKLQSGEFIETKKMIFMK